MSVYLNDRLSVSRRGVVVQADALCHARPTNAQADLLDSLEAREQTTTWRIHVPLRTNIAPRDILEIRQADGVRPTDNLRKYVVETIRPSGLYLLEVIAVQQGYDRDERRSRILINGTPADVNGLDAYISR